MSARVLVADPPWKFGDKLGKKGAAAKYPVLQLHDIMRFPLPVMLEDSVLFLWRVSSQVEEAYQVVRAWGFVPKSELVWSKTNGEDEVDEETGEIEEAKDSMGMGRIVRGAHETCIIATRGKAHSKVLDRGVRTVFRAPRAEHSAKPEEFYAIVEKLFGGPYVEIFSRRERKGWDCFGNELSRAHPGAFTISAGVGVVASTVSIEIDAEAAKHAIRESVDLDRCSLEPETDSEEVVAAEIVQTIDETFARVKLEKPDTALCSICFARQFITQAAPTCRNGHHDAKWLKAGDVTRHTIALAVCSPSWQKWTTTEADDAKLASAELPGKDVTDEAVSAPAPASGLFRGHPIDAFGACEVDGTHYSKEYVAAELADEARAAAGLPPAPPPEPKPKVEKKNAQDENLSREFEALQAAIVPPLSLLDYTAFSPAKRKSALAWAAEPCDEKGNKPRPPKHVREMIEAAANRVKPEAPAAEPTEEEDRSALLALAVKEGIIGVEQIRAANPWAELTIAAPAGWFKKARMRLATETQPSHSNGTASGRMVDSWAAAQSLAESKRWSDEVDAA